MQGQRYVMNKSDIRPSSSSLRSIYNRSNTICRRFSNPLQILQIQPRRHFKSHLLVQADSVIFSQAWLLISQRISTVSSGCWRNMREVSIVDWECYSVDQEGRLRPQAPRAQPQGQGRQVPPYSDRVPYPPSDPLLQGEILPYILQPVSAPREILTRWPQTVGVLPPTWKYESATASTLVA